VDELPADTGMAFILVQHLDPTHESMMVDLLAGHTSMTVQKAADEMPDRARAPLPGSENIARLPGGFC